MQVRVDPKGLVLSGKTPSEPETTLPLYAGSLHYWRHPRSHWRRQLRALKELGFRLVDTYVPWLVHEREDGTFDFDTHDVRQFLIEAQEEGLYVILRPGPHINGELTYFGLPKRIVWNPECQARTPRGNPVILPVPPLAFPVPSYASEVFHREVERWYEAVARVTKDLQYPEGPIVLIQVDNEGALYFRDGPYDQDYHPDAIDRFRAFLRAKYGVLQALRAAWGDETPSFAEVMPPVKFDAKWPSELPRHLDWMEFHEQHLAWGIRRMTDALKKSGLDRAPTVHNFPPGEAATPLNAARLSVDMIGLDYYHVANPDSHMMILRRTTELAMRAEGTKTPCFSSEMGAGFPPYFAPIDTDDSYYTLVAALAYGLRGFNLYMAVDRDRWIGAILTEEGEERPHAVRYRHLIEALDKVDFPSLHRHAPVRLVVPRALRRLARVSHAYGPLSPALFNVVRGGFEDACLEDVAGLETGPIAGERFLRGFERALVDRGVPFAYAGGETFPESTKGASWVICATGGIFKRELLTYLHDLRRSGTSVTLGPAPPRIGEESDARASDLEDFELEPLNDLARADAVVAEHIKRLDIPVYPVKPSDLFVTVHADGDGIPRVLFLMNPTSESKTAHFSAGGIEALEDLLGESEVFMKVGGAFSIEIGARSARVFRALEAVVDGRASVRMRM